MVKHLLRAILLLLVLYLAAHIALSVGTRHNQTVTVPDFSGKTVSRCEEIADELGLVVNVSDSVFIERSARGVVVSQNPKPGMSVKKGRSVRVVKTALQQKFVPIPDVTGYSVRQAKVELTAAQLKLGRLNYVNDIATNNVLGQFCHDEKARPDSLVPVGTVIDLLIGLDYSDGYTVVPDLLRQTCRSSLEIIQDKYLNVGRVYYDESVSTYADTLAALVYKQFPEVDDEPVLMGTPVYLYLTLDESRFPAPPAAEQDSVAVSGENRELAD